MSTSIPEGKRKKINRELERSGYQGPLVVDDSLPSEHQGMLSDLRARAGHTIAEVTKADTVRPNIYFDFVEDMRFNAVALLLPKARPGAARARAIQRTRVRQSDYFILINTRVVVDVAGLFRNLFALPQFAAHIGNPSLESELHIRAVPVTSRNASVIDIMPHHPRLPKCPARALIAATLSQAALDFLLLHELGHIRNGHLPYLFPGMAAQLAEAEAFPKGQDDALARHTLEMDADAHAVVHGVNDALALTGSTWSPETRKPLEKLYATPESTLYAYLLPIYALFRCFGKESWNPNTVWTSTHPPPAMRQYMIPGLVHAHLSRGQQLVSPKKAFQSAREVIEDVERGISLLTGVIPDLTGFALAAQYFPVYGRQLSEYWIKAFPHLDKLKLGGRLAPPEPWRDGPEEADQ
ncbi:hypothetical protein SAMN05444161_2934 [Rhizobiales bacterium GAS191]|jgi:hypothetical protein|nr:hypothetical protein SAMN05519103_02133 [Rhizobiales bacterium GAS113]SED29952.1 hypothetical protein SAMN05444161_2934 [Rhizobiales bacterium GAS191]